MSAEDEALAVRVGVLAIEAVIRAIRGGDDLSKVALIDAIGSECVTEIARLHADAAARRKFGAPPY